MEKIKFYIVMIVFLSAFIPRMTVLATEDGPEFEHKSYTIYKGSAKKLKCKLLSDGEEPVLIKSTWSSDNTKVASVNQKGKVIAKKAGTAKISCKMTYRVYGIKKTRIAFCKIKVTTQKVNTRASLNKLVRNVSYYCLDEAIYDYKKVKRKTIKNTNNNRKSIAAYVLCLENKYQYSKKTLDKAVLDLFGKKISNYSPCGYLGRKDSNTFIYGGGDPEEGVTASVLINRIQKKGNKCVVYVTGKAKYYDEDTGYSTYTTKKICNITLTLKKNSKSKYGYIIHKMRYERY